MIQEARAYRKEGFLAHHDSDRQIKQLEAEVDALEEEITRLKRKQGGRIAVDDPEFLEKFLDDSYKSLEELLQDIVESGALDDLVRKRVGKQLYYLAAQNTVEYEPGWGWKLSTTEE